MQPARIEPAGNEGVFEEVQTGGIPFKCLIQESLAQARMQSRARELQRRFLEEQISH